MSTPATPGPAQGPGQGPMQQASIKDVVLYEMLHHDDYMIGPYSKTDKIPNATLETPTRLIGERVEFSDEKMTEMGIDCVTQMMGEITHLALMHPERRKNLVGDMESLKPFADVAADLAVFHNLSSEKRNVSGKFVKPSDFGFDEGLAMEEYFIKLIELAKQKGHDPEDMPTAGPPPPGGQPQQGQDQGQGQGQGQPGQGPGGQPQPSQDPNPTASDIMKALGKDPGGVTKQDHTGWGEVPVGAQEAAKQAMIEGLGKGRGSLPGGMQRLLDQLMGEKEDVRWQERMRRLIGSRFSTTKYRKTLKRPSRRWGIGYPGKVKIRRGTLAVAVDTSGSMSDLDLSMCLHHLRTISKCHQAPLYLMVVDADIHIKKYINRQDDLDKIELKGGGGTSSLPVFEHLEKQKVDMLIYLTDLDIDFPDKKPRYPVIWGVINNPNRQAPFGESFHIKIEDKEHKTRRRF